MIKKHLKDLMWGVVLVAVTVTSSFSMVQPINAEKVDGEARREELYRQRLELCGDFEHNEKEIEKIDELLENEGVQEVDSTYVREKVELAEKNEEKVGGIKSGQAQTYIATPRERGVKWTSTRRITTYNGKQYEIQELKAQANSSNSSLDIAYASISTNKNSSKKAAKWTILQCVSGYVLGLIPEMGGGISTAQTVYSCLKARDNGLKASTTVKNVQANYTIHFITEYTLCFVKPQGAADTSQILGYAGNYSTLKTTTVIPKATYGKKHVEPSDSPFSKNGFIASPKYSSGRWNFACKYYTNYKKGLSGDCHFNLSYQVLKLNNGETRRFNIPRMGYGF